MLKIILIVSFLSLSLSANQLIGKVVRVHDGETFTIEYQGKYYKIKLEGVEAPTKGEKHFEEFFTSSSILLME